MTKRQVYDFFNQQNLISTPELRSLLELHFKQSFTEILVSTSEVDSTLLEKIKSEILKVQQGYPLSYILNEQDFFKSKFYVSPSVLIPRPETEFLVEFITKQKEFKDHKLIMDIGAGSGCIGISLLKELDQGSQCVFIEKSLDAIEVLKENLNKSGLKPSSYHIYTDLTDVPKDSLFDLIVSNPPYIDEKDTRVDENVRLYEPQMALFAKDGGLFYLKNWSEWSMNHLKKSCKVFFEFGLGQANELRQFCQEHNWDYQILKDQYDVDRFLVIKHKG